MNDWWRLIIEKFIYSLAVLNELKWVIIMSDDCDESDYQSIMFLTCRFKHDLNKPQNFTRVAAVLLRWEAVFTKWCAEFVKFFRGKMWAIMIGSIIADFKRSAYISDSQPVVRGSLPGGPRAMPKKGEKLIFFIFCEIFS